MGTIKLKTQRRTKDNYTLPGKPMTVKEFRKWVKDAEKSPTISLEEFNKKWEQKLKGT